MYNINATYIPVCFSITGVPLASIFLFHKRIFWFHSIVNLCKHGKLPNLSNLILKRDFKPEEIVGNLKKCSPKTLPVVNEFAGM